MWEICCFEHAKLCLFTPFWVLICDVIYLNDILSKEYEIVTLCSFAYLPTQINDKEAKCEVRSYEAHQCLI